MNALKFLFLMFLAALGPNPAGIVKGKVAKKAKHGVEPVCQIPVNPKEPAECLVGSASYADREACCILLESDYARCGIAALVSNMDPEDRIFQDSKDKAAVKPTQVEDCIAEPDSEKISKAKRLECCGHLQGGLRTQCTIGVTTMDRAVELMNRGTGCAGEAEDKP